jgi:hypothetical protein
LESKNQGINECGGRWPSKATMPAPFSRLTNCTSSVIPASRVAKPAPFSFPPRESRCQPHSRASRVASRQSRCHRPSRVASGKGSVSLALSSRIVCQCQRQRQRPSRLASCNLHCQRRSHSRLAGRHVSVIPAPRASRVASRESHCQRPSRIASGKTSAALSPLASRLARDKAGAVLAPRELHCQRPSLTSRVAKCKLQAPRPEPFSHRHPPPHKRRLHPRRRSVLQAGCGSAVVWVCDATRVEGSRWIASLVRVGAGLVCVLGRPGETVLSRCR